MTRFSFSKVLRTLACATALATLAAAPLAMADNHGKPLHIGGIDQAGGTIKGTVKFEGEQKARRPIRMDADPYCARAHADKPALSKLYIFGDNDTLQNVFVQVTKGLEGKDFTVPGEAHVIDQVGCEYIPHVSGVMTGQNIKILNSDNTLHNVKATPQKNPGFNQGMPVKGMVLEKTFNIPEAIMLQCDVHAWMRSYVHVVEHPFFAVTQQEGTFEIKGLPAGEYEISFWHELRAFAPDKQTVTVTVGEGETQEVTVTYAPRQRG